jgi:hypothetical protein
MFYISLYFREKYSEEIMDWVNIPVWDVVYNEDLYEGQPVVAGPYANREEANRVKKDLRESYWSRIRG